MQRSHFHHLTPAQQSEWPTLLHSYQHTCANTLGRQSKQQAWVHLEWPTSRSEAAFADTVAYTQHSNSITPNKRLCRLTYGCCSRLFLAKCSCREVGVWHLGWPGDRSEASRSCHTTYTRQQNSAMRRSTLLCPTSCHTPQHLPSQRPSVAAEKDLRNLCTPTVKGTQGSLSTYTEQRAPALVGSRLLHLIDTHRANEEICNRCGGTEGGGESGNDCEKLVASSAARVLRYRHRQNRYATTASFSARPQKGCNFSDLHPFWGRAENEAVVA